MGSQMEVKVSIITAAYNCRKFFKETFDSVLSQTYASWEWIIVEDHSTDDSFSYIESLVKGDSRITLIRTERNSGTAVARNLGLNLAKGQYIDFLDADDFLDKDYLEKQVAFMKDNGPLITSGYRRLTEHSCTDFIAKKDITYKALLKSNSISCLATMYDKNQIGDVRFPEDMDKNEDYVFWLNILKKGYTAKVNSCVLTTYRLHGGNKSRNKFALIKYTYRVYRKSQKLNPFKGLWYLLCWAFNGLWKYKNIRF